MTIHSELISCYTFGRSREFEVFYETFPAEPDVGYFGNGRECVEIVEVKLCYGSRKKRIAPPWDLEDDLAHIIYERMA